MAYGNLLRSSSTGRLLRSASTGHLLYGLPPTVAGTCVACKDSTKVARYAEVTLSGVEMCSCEKGNPLNVSGDTHLNWLLDINRAWTIELVSPTNCIWTGGFNNVVEYGNVAPDPSGICETSPPAFYYPAGFAVSVGMRCTSSLLEYLVTIRVYAGSQNISTTTLCHREITTTPYTCATYPDLLDCVTGSLAFTAVECHNGSPGVDDCADRFGPSGDPGDHNTPVIGGTATVQFGVSAP